MLHSVFIAELIDVAAILPGFNQPVRFVSDLTPHAKVLEAILFPLGVFGLCMVSQWRSFQFDLIPDRLEHVQGKRLELSPKRELLLASFHLICQDAIQPVRHSNDLFGGGFELCVEKAWHVLIDSVEVFQAHICLIEHRLQKLLDDVGCHHVSSITLDTRALHGHIFEIGDKIALRCL